TESRQYSPNRSLRNPRFAAEPLDAVYEVLAGKIDKSSGQQQRSDRDEYGRQCESNGTSDPSFSHTDSLGLNHMNCLASSQAVASMADCRARAVRLGSAWKAARLRKLSLSSALTSTASSSTFSTQP